MTGSLALFCVLLALLSAQLRSGRDPAVGARVFSHPAAAPAPRRVIVRRIEDDEVVTRVIVVPAPSSPSRSALVTSASRAAGPAVTQAPAPAQTSAPAPAPAPLVTRSS